MEQSILDNFLLQGNFSTPDMAKIFSEENTIRQWLVVEAALAQAQAKRGIIPPEAAATIAERANKPLDMDKLCKLGKNTGHPFLPTLSVFTESCGEYAGYVHLGATTQDILDTGMVLQLRQANHEIRASLNRIIEQFEGKAQTYRNTVMMGRTNGQQALPITLGFKFAVWLSELKRHADRLYGCQARLLTAQFSGAVGTLASLGEHGIEVVTQMCQILGLSAPVITWNTARDSLVEWCADLTLLASTLGKVGNEVYALQKHEIGELEDNAFASKVGSSTMPHKKNPFMAMQVASLGKLAKSIANEAFQTLEMEHERDPRGMNLEMDYLVRISHCCHAALEKSYQLTETLLVHEDKMQKNMELLHGAVLSESVMMYLSTKMGRHKAHHILNELVTNALTEDVPLIEVLLSNNEVMQYASEEALQKHLDPANYLGSNDLYIDAALAQTYKKDLA